MYLHGMLAHWKMFIFSMFFNTADFLRTTSTPQLDGGFIPSCQLGVYPKVSSENQDSQLEQLFSIYGNIKKMFQTTNQAAIQLRNEAIAFLCVVEKMGEDCSRVVFI